MIFNFFWAQLSCAETQLSCRDPSNQLHQKEILIHADCLATQSRLTLCHPIHCSPPGFSVHGILQARTLEWTAVALLQRIFLTQGLNAGLLHCRRFHDLWFFECWVWSQLFHSPLSPSSMLLTIWTTDIIFNMHWIPARSKHLLDADRKFE